MDQRRPIDHRRPLIVINDFRMAYPSGHDDYETWWQVIPDDLRPYVAMATGNWPDAKAGEVCREWCEAQGIPFFLEVYTNSRSGWQLQPDEVAARMERYPHAIGIWVCEGRHRDVTEVMKAFLPVVAEHGGYLFASMITGWQFAHNNMELYQLARRYADCLAICIKANGNQMRYTPGAYIAAAEKFVGLWLTGAMGQWGWHPESFLWFEFGYTTLYGPRRNEHGWQGNTDEVRWDRGKLDAVVQMLGFPENLMAQEILNAAIHGCTIFSGFEHPSMALAMNGTPTPMFTQCLLPILREIVARGLIPSREEVRQRTKVATLNSCVPVYATKCAVVQDIGRYGLIPALPHYTPASPMAGFETVLEMQATAEDLDRYYPEESRGSAFCERQGNRWYLWNPHENRDQDAVCDLGLQFAPCQRMSAVLTPHSLVILEESPAGLDLYLSNFRSDKAHLFDEQGLPRRGLWDTTGGPYGYDANWPVDQAPDGLPANYLEYCFRTLIRAPVQGPLRRTRIELHGWRGAGRPVLSIEGHSGFAFREGWDPNRRVYQLEVDHNGVVRAKLARAAD